ncbi:MAG: hypothetical protein FWH42_02545 [Dehalococcoidia bacterium]|nr:hypothetical protein [Dehalococcoidia bacterium]
MGYFGILLILSGIVTCIIIFPAYFNLQKKNRQNEEYIKYLESCLKSSPKTSSDDPIPATPKHEGPLLEKTATDATPIKEVKVTRFCPVCGTSLVAILTSQQLTSVKHCPRCGVNLAQAALGEFGSDTHQLTLEKSPAAMRVEPSETKTTPTVNSAKKPLSMAAMILMLGAFFILTAGTIFATTSWNSLTNSIRALVIFALPVFFMGLSLLFDWLLKLTMTGKAFYYLGSLFIPVAFLAVNQFSIFGEWFTFYGGGAYALWSICFVLLAVFALIGSWRYRSAVLVYLTCCAFTATLWSLTRLIGGYYQAALLVVSLLSLSAIVYSRHERKGWFQPHIRIYAYLSLILNVLMGFAYTGADSIFHLLAVIVIFATYSFCVFRPVWAQEKFLQFYPLMAVWLVWNSADIIFGYEGSILNIFFSELLNAEIGITPTLYLNINHTLFVTIALGMLFFIFRFAPAIGGIKLRNIISDLLFFSLSAVLIPIWLYASNAIIYYWLAIVCIVNLAFITFILGRDTVNKYSAGLAYATPHLLILLWAPIVLIVKETSNSAVLTKEVLGFTSITVFTAVAVIGVLINYAKEGLLQKRYRASFNIAVVSWGLIWLICMLVTHSNFCSWYVLAIGLYSLLVFIAGRKKEKYLSQWIWISACALAFVPFCFVFYYTDADWLVLVLCLAAAGMVMLISPLRQVISGKASLPELTTISAIFLNASAVLSLFAFSPSDGLLAILAIVITALLSMISLYFLQENTFNIIGILVIWAAVFEASTSLSNYIYAENFNVPLMAMTTMFALMLILGRVIFGKKLFKDTPNGRLLDYLSLSAIITPFIFLCSEPLFGVSNRYVTHGSLIVFMVYGCCFLGRKFSNEYNTFNKHLISLVLAIAVITFLTQPYILLPGLITTEYNLVVLLVAVVLYSVLWNKTVFSRHALFITAAISVLIQFSDIIGGEYRQFDAALLGVVMALILFGSFFFKKRRWFLLSLITLAVFAIYLSKDFWLSISWWVYLMVCGTIMIIVAAVFEYRRRVNKSHRQNSDDKIDRFIE